MNKDLIKKLGFKREVELVEQNYCPFCAKKINMNDFKDEISKKEYTITGLCQNCQNDLYKE